MAVASSSCVVAAILSMEGSLEELLLTEPTDVHGVPVRVLFYTDAFLATIQDGIARPLSTYPAIRRHGRVPDF